MKVTGPTGPTPAGPSARPARASGGFSVPQGGAGAASATTASSASGSVAGVSALMALQGVEDPLERRRRSIRRGAGLLDRLDDLKLSLLSGQAPGPALERLARSVREERGEGDGDAGLAAVLDQIDLRAAVELAKAESARV